ncbi:hypothetical protein HDU78_011686 [Chytriomyces hyalinus]|nr:hypothetical protein HDU78_011686 [Chytriomyces hyalinus]
MPALRIVPVVKKYKSQKLDGAEQLPTMEFDGTYDELKQALWELAKPHIKGLARVVENELELDRTEQTIDQIADFVVISRSSRSYTFGDLYLVPEVATPVFSINEDLSNITKRSVVESLTTFIYVYSRHLTKVGDYERVKDQITGGAGARDRAGAPNQNRWVEIVSRLREIHTGLVGKDMVWNSWAGLLLQNQETLEARIVMPPPPEVTILFERQSHTSQQLHHIKHSLRIALDVVEEQEANMQQQQRNLTAHRHAIQHVLNAVTPEETAAAASTFDSVENIPDDDHSVGTRDGDNELWSDAVDRED